ncbi:MAG: alpha/beta hydrolase [Oceanicoccus sp.]
MTIPNIQSLARLTAATFFVLALSPLSIADSHIWNIEQRQLPPPAAASVQLRQSIASATAPSVAMRQLSFKDNATFNWDKVISERATASNVLAQQLVTSLGITINNETIAGVNVYHLTPKQLDPQFKDRLFLYVHGGAYVFGGGFSGVSEAAMIANASNIQVLSVDYRMPPSHPFPAAVDDVLAVYKHLLKSMPATSIAIGGTSAGGGLALASVHKFKAEQLELPAAIYTGTPWADLSKTSDSLYTNEGIDRVLVAYEGLLKAGALLYADGNDLKHPLISPVYGDFSGFPPVYMVTGTRDMLLSDTARVHRKLRIAGITADLNVYEGMSHAGYAFNPGSPESKQTYSEMKIFLSTHLR